MCAILIVLVFPSFWLLFSTHFNFTVCVCFFFFIQQNRFVVPFCTIFPLSFSFLMRASARAFVLFSTWSTWLRHFCAPISSSLVCIHAHCCCRCRLPSLSLSLAHRIVCSIRYSLIHDTNIFIVCFAFAHRSLTLKKQKKTHTHTHTTNHSHPPARPPSNTVCEYWLHLSAQYVFSNIIFTLYTYIFPIVPVYTV